MINFYCRSGQYQSWKDVPVSTEKDVLDHHAAIIFIADNALSEKVQRVFNGVMFFIAAGKLLSFIPPIASIGSTLSNMGFAVISGSSLLQIPVVVTIMAIVPKIIVTLALVVVARKILAVVIHYIIYPAVIMSSDKEANDKQRWKTFEDLTEQNFECRRITLNKCGSGMSFDAFAFEHANTKGNGQWVIVAGGNGWIGESASASSAEKFQKLGFNVLYVNGPGVGRSLGFATSYSIGAAQEAGLQFLEKVVKAKKILLYGTSLGSGAQSEAIKSHQFKKDIDYMVWSDRSFNTLSNVASSLVTILVKPIFFLLGIELDGIGGAKKLQKLGITHIVTQNSRLVERSGTLPLDDTLIKDNKGDGVIPNNASLYLGLKKAGIQDSERVKCYGGPSVWHNGDLPYEIEDLVEGDIRAFLARQ